MQLIGLRHTQHCLAEPLVTLSCIVDPAPAGATLAETHGVPYFASVDEMLAGRAAGCVAVDGAILATPNATHVVLGSQLVRAGVHTLVEKVGATHDPAARILCRWQRSRLSGM
jgi:predicted dehydrogenase